MAHFLKHSNDRLSAFSAGKVLVLFLHSFEGHACCHDRAKPCEYLSSNLCFLLIRLVFLFQISPVNTREVRFSVQLPVIYNLHAPGFSQHMASDAPTGDDNGAEAAVPLRRSPSLELLAACKSGDGEEAMRLLDVQGVDVNARDWRGKTPLIYAIEKGDEKGVSAEAATCAAKYRWCSGLEWDPPLCHCFSKVTTVPLSIEHLPWPWRGDLCQIG